VIRSERRDAGTAQAVRLGPFQVVQCNHFYEFSLKVARVLGKCLQPIDYCSVLERLVLFEMGARCRHPREGQKPVRSRRGAGPGRKRSSSRPALFSLTGGFPLADLRQFAFYLGLETGSVSV